MRATTPTYSEEFKSKALALMDRDQRPFGATGMSFRRANRLREAAHAGDARLADGRVDAFDAGYHPASR